MRKRSPIIPHGFAWLEGKFVKELREHKVVLKVIAMWKSGKSYTAIVRTLNDRQLLTRNGKKWFQSSVGAIIKRPLLRRKAGGDAPRI